MQKSLQNLENWEYDSYSLICRPPKQISISMQYRDGQIHVPNFNAQPKNHLILHKKFINFNFS